MVPTEILRIVGGLEPRQTPKKQGKRSIIIANLFSVNPG